MIQRCQLQLDGQWGGERVDNAGAESVWSSFKQYSHRHTVQMIPKLVAAVDNWMNFFVPEHRSSAIGMRPPKYEHTLKAAREAS
jgi:hypothetical protein